MTMKQDTEKKLKVTQLKSSIGQKPKTKAALKALGLGRIGDQVIVPDRLEIRGMLRKVSHLIGIIEEENA
jgi:large subunit ribosomal protein L30